MVATFNPSWRGITAALRLAVLAAGGTPSVTVYPANWGGAIRAIDDLRAQLVTASLAGHLAAADPHPQYSLDTDLAAHASNTSNPHSTTAAQVGAIATTAAGAASGVATLDGSTKLTPAQLPLGTSSATAAAGNDARLSDARTPTAHNQLAATITDFSAAVGLTPLGLICQGRLTFTSGTAVTTADVTAATTLYFTPYFGNGIDLWNGSAWQFYSFTELSLSLSGLAANTNYDVFISDAPGLTLTAVAWTNSLTRSSAISLRDGVWVKTSDNRRLLGTFRTTATIGQSEDSVLRRFLSNAQNLEMRRFSQLDTTASWTYATATWRQTRATATNQVEVLLTLPGRQVAATFVQRNGGGGYTAIGLDSTTAPYADVQVSGVGTASVDTVPAAFLNVNNLALGYHTLTMLEFASGTVTFNGVIAGLSVASNLKGFVMG